MASSEPSFNVRHGYVEETFWKDFDFAVCGFCKFQLRSHTASASIINTMVGSELDWVGHHGLLFLVHKLVSNEIDIRTLENRCAQQDSSLDTELSLNRNLRRQLSQLQRTAQDADWRVQEQLAALTSELELERAKAQTLEETITRLEAENNQQEGAINDSSSNIGDQSPVTSVSIATTPAAWRDRRSFGSMWSSGGRSLQSENLLRIAERLNITPGTTNEDDHDVI